MIVTDIKQESAYMEPTTVKAAIPPKTEPMTISPTTVTMKNVEPTTVKATIPPKTEPVTISPATVKKAIPPTKMKNEI